MTQLVQNIYLILPYLFVALLLAATVCAFWLITALNKQNKVEQNVSAHNRLFLKRGTARLQKMQLH